MCFYLFVSLNFEQKDAWNQCNMVGVIKEMLTFHLVSLSVEDDMQEHDQRDTPIRNIFSKH